MWLLHPLVEERTVLRLSVPSRGPLYKPSLGLLRSCGLNVKRTNLRRYAAEIPSMPGIAVHFQRAGDIGMAVEEGGAEMGVVGEDQFLETQLEGGRASIVIKDLGFGQSDYVIAVPDFWVDVMSLADLAELSLEFRAQGTQLRIASKYPRLAERFLLSKGVYFFSMVQASGTLEAAPAMDYSDIIADISSTGATLRENRLKTIHDGVIMRSRACLIGNRALIASSRPQQELADVLMERITGRLS